LRIRTIAPCVAMSLTACGGAPVDSPAPSAGVVAGRAVRGTVLSYGGLAVPRAKVRVGDIVTTTDDHGRFAVDGVSPQYDAMVVREHDHTVFAFPNLAQSNPALWLYEPISRPRLNYQSTVRVVAPSADIPNVDILYFAEINAPTDDGFSLEPSVSRDGRDGADLTFAWSGGTSAGVSVHALRYEVDPKTMLVTRYTGFVSRLMQIEDGRTSTWTIDRFDAIGTKAIPTQLDVSASLTLEDATFGMQPFGSTALTILPVAPPSIHETLELVPDLPDATFVLAALGTPTGAPLASASYAMSRMSHASQDASKMSLRLSRTLRVLSPERGAQAVSPATDFTWEPSAEALTHVVIFTPTILTPVVAPDVYVQTSEASAHLPDASALGVDWPSTARYTWKVITPSWMPDPGNGKPRPSAYDDDHVSVSETRPFDVR
jgi:hypothetical protein